MPTRYFEYIIDKITSAKSKALILAKDIGHQGIAGEIREIAVKECIEPFLTHSYRCGTGKVIDTFERLSDQIDLIIYHRKVAPPILVNSDLGLFPVECVRYVFEIKTRITATEIKDAIKKFSSIRSLTSFPRKQENGTYKGGSLPSAVLFAFESDINGSEIERLTKYDSGESPVCTVLCVLGKGYWYHANGKWHGMDTSSQPLKNIEFCIFMTGLMNTLAAEETTMKPFRPGGYVNVDNIILYPSD